MTYMMQMQKSSITSVFAVVYYHGRLTGVTTEASRARAPV